LTDVTVGVGYAHGFDFSLDFLVKAALLVEDGIDWRGQNDAGHAATSAARSSAVAGAAAATASATASTSAAVLAAVGPRARATAPFQELSVDVDFGATERR
jgi:hypothetical protein